MSRQKANIHYLYKTTCIITGRYYIGMHSTCNLEDGYIGSGLRLRRSVRKHGIENHKKEILEFFESRELLIIAEENAITPEMITDNMCMNLTGGGKNSFDAINNNGLNNKVNQCSLAGKSHANRIKTDKEYAIKHAKNSSKTLKKSHQFGKIKYNTFTGKKHSEETKKKISDKAKGRTKGEDNSQYGTCWITKDGLNKKIKKENFDIWFNDGWVKGRK